MAPRITWSTQFNWGANAFYNNGGVDDAYYEDPTLHPGLNPFNVTNGALQITASPLAKPTTAPDGFTRHWSSGELTGPPITYGYLEISAKLPDLQGFWPAFWLHPANGNTYVGNANAAEYDVAELFGSAYQPGTIQQTTIATYAANGKAQFVRTVVSSASTAFHTYGILWTPAGVNYYIDRKPVTPIWPNLTTGPENAQLTLQVFADGTWAPAPAGDSPQSMTILYYHAYQSTKSACSPSAISLPT